MNPGDAHLLELLDEHTEVAFGELLRAFETSREELLELVAWGVIEPRRADRAQSGFIDEDAWRFSSRALVVAHRAARLRRGFELDTSGLALALGLLDRIDELQRRVRELECQLPR